MPWAGSRRSSRSPSGIENTNYFVTTDRGRFVLTLYERLPADELPFYLNLMAHLARAGVEAPAPVADRTGAFFSMLNGKPASLVDRVDGAPIDTPDAAHCAAVGAALARMHVASQTYRARLTNRRGPALVATGGARGQAVPRRRAQTRCSHAEIKFQTGFGRAEAAARARSTAIFFATTCCSRGRALPASSTSASPPPISSPTTSPSRSTIGASMPTAARLRLSS